MNRKEFVKQHQRKEDQRGKHSLSIYVTTEESRKIRQAAGKLGLSVTTYIKSRVLYDD